MSKPRTLEEEQEIEREFARLMQGLKFSFGNEAHIRLSARIGRVLNDEKLMKKNEAKKSLASAYRAKVFQGKKDLIASLKHHHDANK
jgi:hypothetical protein